MKSKLIALALFSFTAVAVAFYPNYKTTNNEASITRITNNIPDNQFSDRRPEIEVVFVLDTTGSMGGLIQAAKEKIWSIASTMASAQPAPEIKVGLVAYRDRGDAYVTKIVELSSDLDSVYATLMDFQATGGGDGPESVNQALHDAIHKISWSQNPNAYKVVFLIGDAPPHMDYQDDVKYPATINAAAEKGIVVNAIQCGRDGATTKKWQQIASLGGGKYLQVGQSGSAVAIATPFDKKLAELSKKLDGTRLYYGTPEEKAKQQRKVDATSKLHASSSIASRARRALFNASKSGKTNFLGEGELVEDIASGRVDLAKIERDELPKSMQAMAPEAQQALIASTTERRNKLQREIKEINDQRSGFLRKKVEESGGAKDSLDHKVYDAIREQAATKGLHYEADAPAY